MRGEKKKGISICICLVLVQILMNSHPYKNPHCQSWQAQWNCLMVPLLPVLSQSGEVPCPPMSQTDGQMWEQSCALGQATSSSSAGTRQDLDGEELPV